MKIEVKLEKTTDGYSAFYEYEGYFVSTVADSYSELKAQMIEATELAIQQMEADGLDVTNLKNYRLSFILEVGSFFELFPTLNMSGFAKFIGVNASLIRQYAKGIKKPSEKRTEQILKGIHELGKQYQEVTF